MPDPGEIIRDPWPPLSYPDFADTHHFLHMGLQVIGKLKLKEPFQPQWSGIPLWISARGLTTGPVHYACGAYEISVDLISHEIACVTNWGYSARFDLASMSVAEFVDRLFHILQRAGVDVSINFMPQEVASPIPFDQDKTRRSYEPVMANSWWQILLSIQRVMEAFRGSFQGKTQRIGIMWGTLDIRDTLFNGKPASPGAKADYIRRNAMNAELIEMGWWAGSAAYPKPAFYSFTHPQPKGIEDAKISPPGSRWDHAMGEFIFDYDDLRKSKDPDGDLQSFFRSAFDAGAERAGWDPNLMGTGRPD
jgi:hypothetical protein